MPSRHERTVPTLLYRCLVKSCRIPSRHPVRPPGSRRKPQCPICGSSRLEQVKDVPAGRR